MSAIAQVAASLIRGWREGRQQPLPTLELASEAKAYAVQHQVADALGWFASLRVHHQDAVSGGHAP